MREAALMARPVHPDQLELVVLKLALADRLLDRKRMPADGAAHLLCALIQRELELAALPAAVALVVELDNGAAARRTESRSL
jgi:hypothetical protein